MNEVLYFHVALEPHLKETKCPIEHQLVISARVKPLGLFPMIPNAGYTAGSLLSSRDVR
jgi:hypothetical protein